MDPHWTVLRASERCSMGRPHEGGLRQKGRTRPCDEVNQHFFKGLELIAKVFRQIDEYAPGFEQSIVGYEVLAPPDLERIFGITGGVGQQFFIKISINNNNKYQ